MKTTVISYSLTGNNRLLAEALARRLGAEHREVTESGERSIGRIALDMLFNRTPPVQGGELPGETGRILLVGPVWMGCVASPLRGCLRELKKRKDRVGFVSISGGADGPNPKLEKELTRRLGRSPEAVVDIHIADLLPPEPRPTRDDTSAYRLSGGLAESLAEKALPALAQPAN